jgi:hypothetical protein
MITARDIAIFILTIATCGIVISVIDIIHTLKK